MSFRGPRILFKTDEASSIGRGAVIRAGHFRPEVAVMIWALAVEADPAWAEILITEGDRPRIRPGRDLHPELRALDVGLNHISGSDEYRRDVGQRWGDRTTARLGPGYQAEAHGSLTSVHLHLELDP